MPDDRVCQARYPAAVTCETLAQVQAGVTLAQVQAGVRVWDTPRSQLEGARSVDAITVPTRVDVIAEQFEPFSEKLERARIRYQGKEGWVLAIMLTRES